MKNRYNCIQLYNIVQQKRTLLLGGIKISGQLRSKLVKLRSKWSGVDVNKMQQAANPFNEITG